LAHHHFDADGESRIGWLLAHSCVNVETPVAQGTAGNLYIENSVISLMISVKTLEEQYGRAGLGAVVSMGCERHR
jgi:hypothetical protein